MCIKKNENETGAIIFFKKKNIFKKKNMSVPNLYIEKFK